MEVWYIIYSLCRVPYFRNSVYDIIGKEKYFNVAVGKGRLTVFVYGFTQGSFKFFLYLQ